MDVLALAISILALFISHTSIVFTKNLEVKSKKFDELVLNELKNKFNSLDERIQNNTDEVVSGHLTFFTDTYVNIALYLIALKELFKNINVNEIQDELHIFSDKLYENPMVTIREVQSNYTIHKMKIMSLIYDQSISYYSDWWKFWRNWKF